jgi:hypothetical protein
MFNTRAFSDPLWWHRHQLDMCLTWRAELVNFDLATRLRSLIHLRVIQNRFVKVRAARKWVALQHEQEGEWDDMRHVHQRECVDALNQAQTEIEAWEARKP